MGFDIVSLLSVRVFASLATASSVWFTIYIAPPGPVLRAVLDAYDVRAPLASMVSTCRAFVSDTLLDTALPAISALGTVVTRLGHDVLDVVPPPLLQLANRLAASAEPYVSPTMAQIYALGSGTVTGLRRIASDYPGTRLVDYFRIFAGLRADTLSATFSVSLVWGTLVLCSICFILYSLWIFFSFEAPLDDNDLRLITTLNTQVTLAIRKIESLSKQFQHRTSNAFTTFSALVVVWPTQVLRARCYQSFSPLPDAYIQDSLEVLRCNRSSHSIVYRQLARSSLCFITRFISIAFATLAVLLVISYVAAVLYTVWTVYLIRKTASSSSVQYTSTDGSSNSAQSSSLKSLPDITPCCPSVPVVNARTLSPRFLEDYNIHPDFYAKYEVVAELGAGGNGFVLQAQRRADGQQVAVKLSLMPNRFSHRWSEHPTYGFVNNDVLIMDLAHHENIIALLDVFSDETYLYIVQELYGTLSFTGTEKKYECLWEKWPNGSRCLESHIHVNGPMSIEDAKNVFYQLVDAVEYLHSLGISHCDIKPENILIDSAALKIKLIDFGNVSRLPAGCIPGKGRLFKEDPRAFLGTRTYTPPEIHNGEIYEANAADVWAMGLVLCFMILGHVPLYQNSIEHLKMGLLGCHADCVETLKSVGLIVNSCLKFKLLLRPTAAELQLRENYLPIALRRDKLNDLSHEELEDMMPYL